MRTLPWTPPFVLHGHPSGRVCLLQTCPKVEAPEPPGCWRGSSNGACRAYRGSAAYLRIRGDDRNGRVKDPILGGLLAVGLEEPGDLDIRHLEGDALEGDEDFGLSWSKGVEGEVVEVT